MVSTTETQQARRARQRSYPAEKARQGEIILRAPWQRYVFIAGFVLLILIALLLRLFA